MAACRVHACVPAPYHVDGAIFGVPVEEDLVGSLLDKVHQITQQPKRLRTCRQPCRREVCAALACLSCHPWEGIGSCGNLCADVDDTTHAHPGKTCSATGRADGSPRWRSARQMPMSQRQLCMHEVLSKTWNARRHRHTGHRSHHRSQSAL